MQVDRGRDGGLREKPGHLSTMHFGRYWERFNAILTNGVNGKERATVTKEGCDVIQKKEQIAQ